MTTPTMPKPRRGRPSTEADQAAIINNENEVVHRHAILGHSFYRIEKDLGITNAERVYKRAMTERPQREREEAARVQALRLEALNQKAWEALQADGLDSLAERVATYMHEYGDEADVQAIRAMIGDAYVDTYRGIPVALKVQEQIGKHYGTDHASRVADAQLELDVAKVRLWGAALADALSLLDVTTEDKRRVIQRWGELAGVESTES